MLIYNTINDCEGTPDLIITYRENACVGNTTYSCLGNEPLGAYCQDELCANCGSPVFLDTSCNNSGGVDVLVQCVQTAIQYPGAYEEIYYNSTDIECSETFLYTNQYLNGKCAPQIDGSGLKTFCGPDGNILSTGCATSVCTGCGVNTAHTSQCVSALYVNCSAPLPVVTTTSSSTSSTSTTANPSATTSNGSKVVRTLSVVIIVIVMVVNSIL